MAVKLRLSDGISLIVRADLRGFQRAYQEALRSNALLEVENGDGKTRVVNPQQILYFEEFDEAEVAESVYAPSSSVTSPS